MQKKPAAMISGDDDDKQEAKTPLNLKTLGLVGVLRV